MTVLGAALLFHCRSHHLCYSVVSVNGAPRSCAVKDSGAFCGDLDIAREKPIACWGTDLH